MSALAEVILKRGAVAEEVRTVFTRKNDTAISQSIRDQDRFFRLNRVSLKHILNLLYLAFLNIITENFFKGIFEAV